MYFTPSSSESSRPSLLHGPVVGHPHRAGRHRGRPAPGVALLDDQDLEAQVVRRAARRSARRLPIPSPARRPNGAIPCAVPFSERVRAHERIGAAVDEEHAADHERRVARPASSARRPRSRRVRPNARPASAPPRISGPISGSARVVSVSGVCVLPGASALRRIPSAAHAGALPAHPARQRELDARVRHAARADLRARRAASSPSRHAATSGVVDRRHGGRADDTATAAAAGHRRASASRRPSSIAMLPK